MSLFDRLSLALQPEYQLEREIASGGMGTVFLARETALDRPVAIKILRPELATAHAVERFLREARTLARLAHPNIVPVHHVGEAGGFYFYVMEYMPGETLAERLRRGPLGVDEVRQLGRDLLDALEIAHRNDIVHRDVKPQNIFLTEGRFVLGDFGIASSTVHTPPRDGEEARWGTPQYMSPEQRYGWEVGPRTDLYGAGLVLYEALTGSPWKWFLPGERADWSRVPRTSGMRRLLRRALAFRPGDRWPDARSFRHHLWRTRVRKYVARTVALTAGGLVVGAVIGILRPSGASPAELAITRFEVDPPLDPIEGEGLANYLWFQLQAYTSNDTPGIDLAVVTAPPSTDDPDKALRELRAKAYVRGRVRRSGGGDSVEASLVFLQRGGVPTEVPVARGNDLGAMACELGRHIVRLLEPRPGAYACLPWVQEIPLRATNLFNEGESAFRQQAWGIAAGRYADALAIDPSFALARWRLLNARRWQRTLADDSLKRAVADLYARQRDDLLEVDRHLLQAWLEPFGPTRIAWYAEALRDLPRDPYTWLVFGDDLFMRGPLAGMEPDSARHVLERAVALDSSLGPALMDLTWGAIRRGDSSAARRTLTPLMRIANPEQATVPPQFFDLAYRLRFGTEDERTAAFAALVGGQGGPADFETFVTFLREDLRWGASFGLAADQARIAAHTLTLEGLPAPIRVLAFEARGLGLMGIGRYDAALADFDSVAALDPDPAAALQAAEWRLLPQALGLLTLPDSVVEEGRVRLVRLTADTAVGDRARWALAVDAYARRDFPAAQTLLTRIRAGGDARAADLVTFLEGVQREAVGDAAGALAATDSLVPYEAPRAAEPFLRTAIYLARGRWRRSADAAVVPSAWLWYLNADITGWPGSPHRLAQSGEIDWAFGPPVRLLRARALLDARQRRDACNELDELAVLWRDGDAVFEPLRHEADSLFSERCR